MPEPLLYSYCPCELCDELEGETVCDECGRVVCFACMIDDACRECPID
jgi:hypothetical protein